ncbi:two-component regulator propeller domain-containing protein [Urechidicola sp. KH5]
MFGQIDYSQNWSDFYSYNNVKDFVKVDSKIYAIVDNAVFIYDETTGVSEKFSSVNGLSGENTTSLHYNESLGRLIIGYENGLIEVVHENGEITISPDITNFPLSTEKSVNDIVEYNNTLYLATAFAIVEYDIENLTFGDTFFIGDQSSELIVNQLAIQEGKLYAATERGIYEGDLSNSNLIDFNNWNSYFTNNFSCLVNFNNQLYVASGRDFYEFNPGSNLNRIQRLASNIFDINSSSTNLSIAVERRAYIYDDQIQLIAEIISNSSSDYYFKLNTVFSENNQFYLGTQEFGILTSTIDSSENFLEIHPDGPNSNKAFSINSKNEHLWIVYGGYDNAYTPLNNRLGFSHFNGETWVNTPYNPDFPAKNLVHITFDPTNIEKVYLSSWSQGAGSRVNESGGILVVENDNPIIYWNQSNSGLEEIFPDNPNYVTVRINGSNFDRDGNLWVANAWVDNMLKKYSPSGQWTSYNLSELLVNSARGLNELVIDKSNSKWIGTRRNGVLIYNENGDRKRSLTTEATKGSLPNLNVRTVAADNANRIWLGTQAGLVVYYNAGGVFDAEIYDAEPIIILDDGIPKKLLGDQPVNSIAIDGADNKWFGTDGGGIVQTTPNGREILNIFNSTNSPLPSNTIVKISVDESTGVVYFATDKGIVAYNSNIASYGEELGEVYAYPNPVLRQHDEVTIDGREGEHLPLGTNVKILDSAGYLVYETNVVEGQELQGGKVVWNKRNLAGRKVASGVYIVLLTNEDSSETSSTKIAIVN